MASGFFPPQIFEGRESKLNWGLYKKKKRKISFLSFHRWVINWRQQQFKVFSLKSCLSKHFIFHSSVSVETSFWRKVSVFAENRPNEFKMKPILFFVSLATFFGQTFCDGENRKHFKKLKLQIKVFGVVGFCLTHFSSNILESFFTLLVLSSRARGKK